MKPEGRNKRSGQVRVPGLDPSSPYLSRLSSRSGLYTDLSLLLDAAEERLPESGLRGMVIDENCLARSSEAADDDAFLKVFHSSLPSTLPRRKGARR